LNPAPALATAIGLGAAGIAADIETDESNQRATRR